ncbi:hypothetical protein CNR22_00870 [Sphingobacteriaceae bacterium]|nr:hypothetical protein CNR22_00870 [Sphingobacteriaceae bacterium]
MKNLLLALSICISGATFAQDLTSKNGEAILPQAKDWSIGLDATRLIKNASFDFVSTSQAITGKYFKDASTAYRIGVRIGVNSWTTKAMVTDRAAASSTIIAYPAAVPSKENSWRRASTSIGLSFGIEKRRGATRLQGVYGVEGGVYLSTTNDKFTYGNKLNVSSSPQLVIDPAGDAMSSPIFGNANNVDTVPRIQGVQGSARVTERKNGLALTIGARVFVGAEYFVLPKMSIGGEFGWGAAFSTSGRSETKLESIGQSNIQGSTGASVKSTTIDGGASNHVGIDTDNTNLLGGLSASLRLNLYF